MAQPSLDLSLNLTEVREPLTERESHAGPERLVSPRCFRGLTRRPGRTVTTAYELEGEARGTGSIAFDGASPSTHRTGRPEWRASSGPGANRPHFSKLGVTTRSELAAEATRRSIER